MGSIRPLITITILVVVGAYLYVKINEGPTPHAVATNALNQAPAATSSTGASLAADNTAPAWPSTTAATANTATVAPQTNQPLPAASATASTSNAGKDNMPAVPAIPELPPLPTMNDPAPAPAQQNIQLPKDLPANTPIARHADQPGAAATGAKKSAPAAPVGPPAISATSTPAAPVNGSLAPAASDAATVATTQPSQASAENPLRGSAAATPPAAAPNDRYATPPTTPASTATPPSTASTTPTTPIGVADGSFAASWPAIQAALDRHDLKQAHQLLSKWHGNESLSPTDTEKVETLLSQLAGTVIYSTEHQLEPARVVKLGETLESISKEYNVPPQLLGKINGIASPDQLKPGQQLKVVRGPFSAVIDVRHNELTLMVDDRYAGKFQITLPQGTTLVDGQWVVDQKLPGPAAPSAYGAPPASADRSIVLRSATPAATVAPTLVIASGSAPAGAAAGPPTVRVSPQDAEEISDILSVGSRVVVRK
jgi:LysM repeat protein